MEAHYKIFNTMMIFDVNFFTHLLRCIISLALIFLYGIEELSDYL